MRHQTLSTALFAILTLSGCQAPYTKIDRTAETSVAPDVYCLIEKLRDVADGRAITYTVEDLPPGTAHSLTYLRSKTYYGWWILVRPDKKVTITHSSGVEDSRPEDLPKVRKHLLEVESLVRDHCGLGAAMDSAEESCRGRACSAPKT